MTKFEFIQDAIRSVEATKAAACAAVEVSSESAKAASYAASVAMAINPYSEEAKVSEKSASIAANSASSARILYADISRFSRIIVSSEDNLSAWQLAFTAIDTLKKVVAASNEAANSSSIAILAAKNLVELCHDRLRANM